MIEHGEGEAKDAKPQIANQEVANIPNRELFEHVCCGNAELRAHVQSHETGVNGIVRKGSQSGRSNDDDDSGFVKRESRVVKDVEDGAGRDNGEGNLTAIVKRSPE